MQKQPYRYCHIVAKLKEDTNSEVPMLKLDVPFRLFASTIIYKNQDITYRLNDMQYKGKEVLACIAYSNKAVPFANEVDESKEVEGFIGYLGHKWEDVKKQAKYLEHYNVKKKDKFATYDKEGIKIEYSGADKEEVAKFREFDEEIDEEIIEGEI